MSVMLMTADVTVTSSADISGDAASHPISASVKYAKWILFISLADNSTTNCSSSAHSGCVRIGDSGVNANEGVPLAVGAGLFFPPLQAENVADRRYDLSQIYYLAAVGDKISIVWGN
jgi:hypothetical protein